MKEKALRNWIHIDSVSYKKKPAAGEVGRIVSRTSHNVEYLSFEEFVEKIKNGFSFIPGRCSMEERPKTKGALQADWVEQSYFFLDFDNESTKTIDIEYITLNDAVEKLNGYGIHPCIYYYSFSNGKIIDGKSIEKFRVGFRTNKSITDMAVRDKVQAILMGLMREHIDPSCRNRNRYFNGTDSERFVYSKSDAVIDADWLIDEYWDDEYLCFVPRNSPLLKKAIKVKKRSSATKTTKKRVAKTYEMIPVDEVPDIFPKVDNPLVAYDMSFHCDEYMELVNAAIESREFIEGTGRRDLIFDVFKMLSVKYGTRKAYEECLKINNQFEVPLSNREFIDCTLNILELDEILTCRYDTLIERLRIDSTIINSLNYGKNLAEINHANKFRNLKLERDSFIFSLHEQGLGYRRIAKVLEENYGADSELVLSESGVKRLLSKFRQVGHFSNGDYIYKTTLPFPHEEGNIENLYKEGQTNSSIENKVSSSPLLENKISMPLFTKEQQAFLDAAISGSNIVLSGFAGSGKSFIVKEAVTMLNAKGAKVAVCAATGMAADKIQGCTVHAAVIYR